MMLLTDPRAKDAFDLSREDDKTRDRYGRNSWGQQLLMARRLVEAGADACFAKAHDAGALVPGLRGLQQGPSESRG